MYNNTLGQCNFDRLPRCLEDSCGVKLKKWKIGSVKLTMNMDIWNNESVA